MLHTRCVAELGASSCVGEVMLIVDDDGVVGELRLYAIVGGVGCIREEREFSVFRNCGICE